MCFEDDLVEKCQTYMWELFIVLLDSHSIKVNSASFIDKIKGSDGFIFSSVYIHQKSCNLINIFFCVFNQYVKDLNFFYFIVIIKLSRKKN